MKKIFKKMVTGLLVAALAFTMAVPAKASAEDFSYDKSKVVYMPSKVKEDRIETISIGVHGMKEKDRVKSITVADKNIASFNSVQFSDNLYETSTDGSTYKEEDWSSFYSYIYFQPLKAGKTSVNFKIGTKSYKSDLTVLAYENPVASMKISGFNNGGELKKLTDKHQWADGIKISKDVSSGKITAKAKSGWKISSISASSNNWYYYMSDYKNSKTSASLNIGKIEKGKYCSVSVTYYNPKTKGEIRCSYYVSGE